MSLISFAIRSYSYDQSVSRQLDLDLIPAFQHLAPQMRENQSSTTKAFLVLGQTRIVEVERQASLKKAALADEQVGILRACHELFRPPGIA